MGPAVRHDPPVVRGAPDVRDVTPLAGVRWGLSRRDPGPRWRLLAPRTAGDDALRAPCGPGHVAGHDRHAPGHEPVGGIEAGTPPRRAALHPARLHRSGRRPAGP